MTAIELTSGPCRLVATTEGGGLLEFSRTLKAGSPPRQILRRASSPPAGPLDRAMILMAPWCNRIGGGGFHFAGKFRALEPNVPPFSMPLHGNAFQQNWEVLEHREDSLAFVLLSKGPAGFRYRAEIRYRLSESGLVTVLAATNIGPEPMPFAVGLHPWFTTTARTSLDFVATGQLNTDGDGLPVDSTAGKFEAITAVPDCRIDKTLLGWNGVALLNEPEHMIELRSNAKYLHVFSPSPAAGFLCLEPQTAPPNFVNMPELPSAILSPGERLSVEMTICVGENRSTNVGQERD